MILLGEYLDLEIYVCDHRFVFKHNGYLHYYPHKMSIDEQIYLLYLYEGSGILLKNNNSWGFAELSTTEYLVSDIIDVIDSSEYWKTKKLIEDILS